MHSKRLHRNKRLRYCVEGGSRAQEAKIARLHGSTRKTDLDPNAPSEPFLTWQQKQQKDLLQSRLMADHWSVLPRGLSRLRRRDLAPSIRISVDIESTFLAQNAVRTPLCSDTTGGRE